MAQGKKLPRGKPTSGGRASKKRMSKLGKGKVSMKPKRAAQATLVNSSRRVTAAITRNIEKEMGHKVQKNGGNFGLLKGIGVASRKGTGKEENAKKKGEEAVDRNGEVKESDSAPKFNPKRRYRC